MKNFKLMLAAFILTVGLSTAAFAGDPKTEVKDSKTTVVTNTATTPAAPGTAVPETKMTGTAVFLYISGDPTNPANYGTTAIDPETACDGGSNLCAATFNVDSHGNRTGNPETPNYMKD